MPALARESDPFTTGHACDGTSVIDKTNTSVMVDGKAAAVVGSMSVTHYIKAGKRCIPHVVPVTSGSSTIFIDGKPAAIVGSAIDNGSISAGAGTSFCGG